MVTGLERTCRAKLVGFASPIGRLSAVLRITDSTTGNFATSVVPVELGAWTDGAAAELTIPRSDVRARELRAETGAVRVVVRVPTGTLLGELLTSDFDCTSAHGQAVLLTTALHRGALAIA